VLGTVPDVCKANRNCNTSEISISISMSVTLTYSHSYLMLGPRPSVAASKPTSRLPSPRSDAESRLKGALNSYRARLAVIETAFAHKCHAVAVVSVGHDDGEPHVAGTHGANNNWKDEFFGFVR